MALIAGAVGMLVCCAAGFTGWFWYERRDCRGAHARTDPNYSPLIMRQRAEADWAKQDAAKVYVGRHHIDDATVPLLSGEAASLFGGYRPKSS
jgi:hypothetical protein